MFFYAFIIFQSLLGVRQAGQVNTLMLAVMLGTLLYLIIGFFQRKAIARLIAIGFHAVYQILLIASLRLMYDDEFIKALLKNADTQTIVFSKNLVLVIFVVVSACNIAAVVYLLRNPDYFVDPEADKDQDNSTPE